MMALSKAQEILSADMTGKDVVFEAVSTDTRNIKAGDLYIALVGERFDGHDFIDQAESAGAVAAIVHKPVETGLSCLKVDDTRKALGQLASAWRDAFTGKVVAITGSNGKTTVKEMTAAILAEHGKVLATKGNFNNDIGLPLTLLRMKDEDYAVIEMGANHHGEIAYLTNLTHPDVALITNAGPAHLDGFGSIKGVATAKGEIYQGIKPDGVAIVNIDDDYGDYWLGICESYKTIGFSMRDRSAQVYGELVVENEKRELLVKVQTEQVNESFAVQLNVPGIHNVMNALAAISAAVALKIDSDCIIKGLAGFSAVKGRLNLHAVDDGFTVIDDTYNANPASLVAGMQVLNETQGEHWLVLGDMGELGEDERRLHFDAGMKARMNGVTCLLATGNASKHAVEAFGTNAKFFDNKNDLVAYINNNRPEKLGLLVKGSRFMQMEKVVEALIKEGG